MNHLVLIGFMGSGKTTLAHKLSTRFLFPIFSTDLIIEQQMNMSIAEIFNCFGEEFFRYKEDEVFAQIQALSSAHIIDCGGGFGAYQPVEQLGEVVFLDIDLEKIVSRLSKEERAKRPLCDFKIKERFEERNQIYRNKAHIVLSDKDELEYIGGIWKRRED